MHDAIVVGLGPAGSTAAYNMARAGLKVLGVDKAAFPRYKSCGGCISTKIKRILDFDISGAVEDTVYGATFTYKSERPADIVSDRPIGFNVMRDKFDALLLSKAKEAGAETIEGVRVKAIEDGADSVTAVTEDGRKFTARVLIGADGASGVTGRLFGLNPKEAAVSITAEVPYDRASAGYNGKLFIDFGCVPYGYAWIFPKDKFLSVGIAADTARLQREGIKAYFNSFVSTHPALKGLKIDGRVGWTVPIYYSGAGPSARGRIILAGDTGHLVDPFLGEGIYFAIRTGKKAAETATAAVKSGSIDLSPYQAWLEGEILPEFRSAEKLADLVYNHPRLWYSIIERDQGIMLKFYDVIRGEEACDHFYRWVFGKVKSKPWKFLRHWIDSRFMPA